MDDSTTLQLGTPPRQQPAGTSFDVRRRPLRRWLATLPLADPAATAQLLLDALFEVNRLTLTPRSRLRFLELLRAPVADAIAALRRIYCTRELPLSGHNQRLARRVEQMLLELCIGYHSLLSPAPAGAHRRSQALLLQRSLHTLGCLLHHYASLYAPPPTGLWAQLHRLYRQAEAQGLEQRVLRDQLAQQGKRSVAATYKHILLLAAAGPYQLRPSALAHAYALTERWAAHATLSHCQANGSSAGTFLVNLAGDLPPSRPNNVAARAQQTLYLDATPIAAMLLRQLQPASWWQFWRRSKTAGLDSELLRQLAASLGLPPLRQSVRLPVQASIEVFIGLTAIHRALVGLHRLDKLDAAADKTHFTSRDRQQDLDPNAPDIWSLIYPTELLRRLAATAPTAAARPPAASGVPGQAWTLLNSSAGGYCLRSAPGQRSRVQIGALLLLREQGRHHAGWQLGIVRWMRQLPDGLQCGVQALGFMPMPALLRQRQEQGRFGSPCRCLLLPANRISQEPASLLTAPLPGKLHQRALLQGPAGEHEILLSRLLESSNGFMRFEYQAAHPVAANLATERRISTI